MPRLGREGQLALLPNWISSKLDVHLITTRQLLEIARDSIPHGARVLDAGSGEGQYRHYFKNTRYIGVDLAVGDPQWNYSAIDAQSDLQRLPFPDNTFDAVICMQVLEHVNEPMRVINEFGRVLRPGGRLYLSAPMAWHQHQKPHDFFRYTSYGFTYLIEQSGMQVIDMQPWGGYFWFLSFNFQMMHDRLFPRGDNELAYFLKLPLILPVYAIFFIALPILLYYLDRLDKVKDHSLGWACIAEKRQVDEHRPTPA